MTHQIRLYCGVTLARTEDLFDDEIIPLYTEERRAQSPGRIIAHEPEPEHHEVPVSEEPAPEQPREH
ncbi:hypothetical protein N7535_002045 [Penicillium sp. DV-2018c]|nr:hypothetical protein N7461_004711 [Penicillium sp. DV-2018c]KAJ5583425.1 hypothetical protein N7535_002045 [Penicillium sp. DV-2018c]